MKQLDPHKKWLSCHWKVHYKCTNVLKISSWLVKTPLKLLANWFFYHRQRCHVLSHWISHQNLTGATECSWWHYGYNFELMRVDGLFWQEHPSVALLWFVLVYLLLVTVVHPTEWGSANVEQKWEVHKKFCCLSDRYQQSYTTASNYDYVSTRTCEMLKKWCLD